MHKMLSKVSNPRSTDAHVKQDFEPSDLEMHKMLNKVSNPRSRDAQDVKQGFKPLI